MNSQNLLKNSKPNSSDKQTFQISQQYSFNYETLDHQTRISVQQKTFEIKGLIRQAAKDIIEVGQKLVTVKQQLKHGEFRNWLKAEFDWSISSATKFMQVYEQFKNINFTHFNFSASALYTLAAPSTPESARKYALELASRGENITYSLAKLIVKHHKESAEANLCPSNLPDLTKETQSENQHTSSEINVVPQDVVQKSDKSVRIIEIKQEVSQPIEDKVQDFHIVYAGTYISVKGSPQDLTVLFRKMQNNPQFAEDIFRQAKSLSE